MTGTTKRSSAIELSEYQLEILRAALFDSSNPSTVRLTDKSDPDELGISVDGEDFFDCDGAVIIREMVEAGTLRETGRTPAGFAEFTITAQGQSLAEATMQPEE